MPEIKKQTLYEIQKEARHYLTSVKGQNFTAEDLVVAENLIVFGYLKALEDKGSYKSSKERCSNY